MALVGPHQQSRKHPPHVRPAPVRNMDAFAAAAQGWSGGPLDPASFGSSPSQGGLLGDPYGPEDNATRGLSLPSSFEIGATSHFGKAKVYGVDGKDGAALPVLERFSEGDVPPEAPQGSFFRFLATTLYVSGGMEPCALANILLDFLLIELMASVTKVRRSKYAIKADISAGAFAGLA